MTPISQNELTFYTIHYLKRKIVLLESAYQDSLEEDRIFEHLKNIRNQIRLIEDQISILERSPVVEITKYHYFSRILFRSNLINKR